MKLSILRLEPARLRFAASLIVLAFGDTAGASASATQSDADYPLEALANGEQGTVVISFDINAEGKVENCRILQSVSPSLDTESCTMWTRRARFEPARDARGNAVREVGRQQNIVWRLPSK